MGRQLRDLLRHEVRLQHRLLALAARSREAIIAREVDELIRLEAEHRNAVAEAEKYARERLDLGAVISRADGDDVTAAELTLSRVAEHLPGDIAIEIGATGSLLLEVAREVWSAHALNRQLLQNELEHIGLSLEVLARASVPRTDYRKKLPDLSPTAIILDKAA